MTIFQTTSEALRSGFIIYDCPQKHRPEWLVRLDTPHGYALAYAITNDSR